MTINDQKSFLLEIFTNEELDAIFDSMSEWQDHGDEESELSRSVISKMMKIFAEN